MDLGWLSPNVVDRPENHQQPAIVPSQNNASTPQSLGKSRIDDRFRSPSERHRNGDTVRGLRRARYNNNNNQPAPQKRGISISQPEIRKMPSSSNTRYKAAIFRIP